MRSSRPSMSFAQARRATLAAMAAIGLLGLAGCESNPDEYAPQCPQTFKLPDADILTRYTQRGTDLTDLVLNARLLDIQGACSGIQGGKRVKAHGHAEMLLTRGPAATSPAVDIGYIVGISRKGSIIEKKLYTQHVVFPPNVNTVHVTGEDIKFVFPTATGLSGPDYHIYFAFDLTPEQLAANRRRPGR